MGEGDCGDDGDGDWAPARAGATNSAAASTGNVIFLICQTSRVSKFRRFGRRPRASLGPVRAARRIAPVGEIAYVTSSACRGPLCTSRVLFTHPTSGRVSKSYTSNSDQQSCRCVPVCRLIADRTAEAMPDSVPRCPPSRTTVLRRWVGALCVGLLLLAARRSSANEAAATLEAESQRVQDIVDAMRLALAVSPDVSVELVQSNPLKASVEPVRGRPGVFRLSIRAVFSRAADGGRAAGGGGP